MEELVSSFSLTNEMCSNGSAQVQVKSLSVSWSCDKKNCVLENVSFEVDQVHNSLIDYCSVPGKCLWVLKHNS